jgi:hypothetical protein
MWSSNTKLNMATAQYMKYIAPKSYLVLTVLCPLSNSFVSKGKTINL